MLNSIRVCTQICLFNKGPQDLPHSTSNMLLLSVGLVALMALIDNSLGKESQINVIYVEMLILLGIYAFIALVLSLANKLVRFQQSMSAIIGIELVLYSLFLALAYVFIPLNMQYMVMSVSAMLYFWRLSIVVHVFKEMLTTDISSAILLAVTFEMFRIIMVLSLGSLIGQ